MTPEIQAKRSFVGTFFLLAMMTLGAGIATALGLPEHAAGHQELCRLDGAFTGLFVGIYMLWRGR